jgi:Uma2 family endonuclease
MSSPASFRMTADEFIVWALAQPECEHYELVDGEVIATAPERSMHARAKGHLYRRLADAVEKDYPHCEAFIDGLSVVIDQDTVYEPDVLVRCGERLGDAVVSISDPIIVIEVVSRASRGRDTAIKLTDYFRLPSIRHYLIVQAEARVIIHHARQEDGTILTRIAGDEPIRLDPPGIVLSDPLPPATRDLH